MRFQLLSIAVAAGVALLASPYLASLTVTAPDREQTRWWQPRRSTGTRCGVTAAVAAVFAALAGATAGLGAAWAAYLALALSGACLAIIDVEHHRLPNRLLIVTAAAGVTLFALAAAFEQRWDRYGRAVLAAAILFAILYLVALVAPRSFGLGDVKLASVLAGYLAWRGWLTVSAGLAGGFLAAGVFALGLLVLGLGDRSTQIPLGPPFIAAALVAAAIAA